MRRLLRPIAGRGRGVSAAMSILPVRCGQNRRPPVGSCRYPPRVIRGADESALARLLDFTVGVARQVALDRPGQERLQILDVGLAEERQLADLAQPLPAQMLRGGAAVASDVQRLIAMSTGRTATTQTWLFWVPCRPSRISM